MSRSAPPSWAPRLHRMHYEPDPGDHPIPAPAPDVRRPAALGRTSDKVLENQLGDILRTALEVLDGRRPPTQLSSGFTRRALRYWRAATVTHARTATPPRITRIRMDRPQANVAELVALVNFSGRYRALPARFERGPDRVWRCTDIRLL
ncbi:Rv3235 family protein [Pseudonocardia sp. CA-107938]|uniref:Rv3235 family protein n=1 Tax=Pseudonocardia sp. CA-107938 TaxID=3240021 RepID=UPI003D89DA3F